MNKQLDALLCKRYPAIFSVDDSEDSQVFGFECGDGWFTLIDATCELIQRHIEKTGDQQLVATQVKEKFGGLRFYYRNGSDHASTVVRFVDSLSEHLCELCGQPGKGVGLSGWMQTRCPEHASAAVYEESLLVVVRENILLAPPIGELLGAALEFFGFDSEAAVRWLLHPNLALGQTAPLALMGTVEGQLQVLTLIRRLEYGELP